MGGGDWVLGVSARVLLRMALGVLGAATSLAAQAYDFSLTDQQLGGDWGRIDFSWNNKITQGAAIRTSKIDYRLIYKQNVPGQQYMCTTAAAIGASNGADCISRLGDPAPSRALINARGAYNANIDDGDLNYGRGDITYAVTQLRSELTGSWRNYSFKVSGIGYYDPVNSSFTTHYRDLVYPARGSDASETIIIHRPSDRSNDQQRHLGRNVQLLDAYAAGDFSLAGRKLHIAVGNQELRWGESTFMLFNNLNQINPLSAELYRQPGAEVKDAFLPVGMLAVSMDLSNAFSVSGFYQYDFKPDAPDVAGSFLSTQNIAGAGNGRAPVYLSQGQYPQDPLGEFVPGGTDTEVDLSSRTAYLKDQKFGYPHNGGQYGIRLDEYAEWLNGGTELSLYAMNIHSRLPYLSAYAANKACFLPYFSDLSAANPTWFSRCYPMYNLPANTPLATLTRAGRPYPVTTVQPFLDYPKDVHTFGASFNTKVSDWSLAGELVYTPNQPAQVQFTDVMYAALQPAFPDTEPGDQFGASPNMGGLLEFPTNRLYAPDYLETTYRHHHVQPGDLVRGYERLQVGQLDLTGIRVFSSSNPIHANQIIFVGELAAIKVFNMPSLDRLQFEGGSTNDNHYSVGNADWNPSYNNGPNGGRAVGPLDVLNPIRANSNIFADSFAWGYRLRTTATYNDVFWGITLQPEVEFHHDVQGTSIYPGQDFVKDRMELTTSNQFLFKHNISARFRYVMHMGAGDRNRLLDRDYTELSASYVF